MARRNGARDKAIRDMVASGVSYNETGRRFGISKQRVEQIVKPRRHKARRALREAVGRGEVVQPSTCQRCGVEEKLEAHHEDYTKPLDVEWLCRRCHVSEHTNGREKRVCSACGGVFFRPPSYTAIHCSRVCGQKNRSPQSYSRLPRHSGPRVDRKKRVKVVAKQLLEYAKEVHRVPRTVEFCEYVSGRYDGCGQAVVVQYVDPGLLVYGSYAAACDAIWRAAGFERP